jgi:hypothetical protein
LVGEFGSHLLLLLRPLQDLGRKLSWHTSWHTSSRHAGILGLTVRVLLLLLRIAWKARRWRLLHWRGAYGLGAHHCLDLFHAHGLSGGRRLLRSGRRLWGRLPLRGWLLRFETPDIGARLQLRDVLRVLVALIACSIGLGRLWNGWPLLVLLGLLLLILLMLLLLLLLLLLGILLTGLVQHLLLLQGAGYHGGLASKVKVFADRLLRGRAAAKGVVVEVIGIVVELVA